MFFYIYIETNLILQLVALAWVILDIRSFYKEYKIGLAIKLKVDNNASKNEIHDFIDNHLPKVLYLSIFENILTIIFIGIVSWKQINIVYIVICIIFAYMIKFKTDMIIKIQEKK